jgi:hypothetical protein
MKTFIILLWSIVIIVMGWSSLIWRPLWSDGSIWLYDIITDGHFFAAADLHRYFTFVAQAPAVIYVNYVENFSISTATTLFSLGYGLFSVMIFTLAHVYLWKKKRIDFVLINMLLYLGIAFSGQAFFVSTVGETVALGSLFFWIFLLEEKSKKIILASLASLILFFCYELAFMFSALYFVLFVVRNKQEKKPLFRYLSYIHLLFSAVFIGIFAVTTYTNMQEHIDGVFVENFFAFPHGLNLISGVLAISFPVVIPKWKRMKFIGWGMISALIAICIYQLVPYSFHHLMNNYIARTTIVPKTVFVLGVVLLMYRVLKLQIDFKKTMSLVFVFFATFIYTEVSNNLSWMKGAKNLSEMLANRKGCTFLEYSHFHDEFGRYGYLDWVFPFTSIIYSEKKIVDTVLFTPRYREATANPCENANGEFFLLGGDFEVEVRPGENIKFHPDVFKETR